ncbi:hypothetical protein [Brevifollis gellanilyticus]|uniref:Roadblock/LAMTOR2 domain-containing protein n=1 Tax=Brevifollis gellanilyticus TaxID=748831 RepID=A0A512M9Q8_9BACT|nr:hypothetical protein [Brevifollis gellanilyticus]GEP43465.1 hypothetical protein BGE01nite_27560 [Brevifollis gellanilyticus]
MNAVLIHADGTAEVVFGEFSGDLTSVAVLTQAAISALEESAGTSQIIQCHQSGACITFVRREDDSWLRVTHEAGVPAEQVREWGLKLKSNKTSGKSSISGPLRVPSLADALNIGMP